MFKRFTISQSNSHPYTTGGRNSTNGIRIKTIVLTTIRCTDRNTDIDILIDDVVNGFACGHIAPKDPRIPLQVNFCQRMGRMADKRRMCRTKNAWSVLEMLHDTLNQLMQEVHAAH